MDALTSSRGTTQGIYLLKAETAQEQHKPKATKANIVSFSSEFVRKLYTRSTIEFDEQ